MRKNEEKANKMIGEKRSSASSLWETWDIKERFGSNSVSRNVDLCPGIALAHLRFSIPPDTRLLTYLS